MGRTLPSAMQVFDGEASRWAKFRRALRREDQEIFDELFLTARRHVSAMAYESSAIPMEAVLLSMLIEECRAVHRLRDQVRRLEEAASPPRCLPVSVTEP
ncbi:MAG: hypothetical protein AAB152_02495 [Candidatus Coatesbacteria bacterium]